MTKNTTLLVARHGNTFGLTDIVRRLGLTDVPLVESGLEQGRKLGNYLKQHNLIPDVIFVSNLKRTQQTAEQALKILGLQILTEKLDMFNEINYGPDENQPEEKVVERLGKETIKAWDESAIVPNGWKVDPQEIIQNWKLFSEDLLKKYADKIILVVTSNGIARFAPYLTGNFEDFSKTHGIKISTGALCIFEHKPKAKTWTCIDWNIKPV
ncbi:MAG TPA: histidine phosphatase family protein [Gammaproteobacteria bacterium]|nr:histidine phosphatase family protein [Gammaproteobacteria bacterium]